MPSLTRRSLLKSSLAGAAAIHSAAINAHADTTVVARKGRIHQSVSRWCYKDIPLDDLSAYAASIGLMGVDLLQPDEYDVPRRHGLICTMGYGGGGEIASALNRTENHVAIEQGFASIFLKPRKRACLT